MCAAVSSHTVGVNTDMRESLLNAASPGPLFSPAIQLTKLQYFQSLLRLEGSFRGSLRS